VTSPDEIEDIMAMIWERGIDISETHGSDESESA